jgi:cell division protein FtsW
LFALNQPRRFPDGMTPLKGNLRACVLGIFLFIAASAVKFDWLKRKEVIITLVVITLAFNLLPFLKPFQRASADGDPGVLRWIFIKWGGRNIISFQPSELIKVVLPVYLAYIIDKKKENLNTIFAVLLPAMFWTGVFCGIVFLQGNFSDTVFIAATAIVICFVGGIRLREIFAVLLALILFVFVLYTNDNGKIKTRIDDFTGRKGYQVEVSLDAIKSGGFWGKGIGQGTMKVRTPEVHGDFVFASYAEESGFLGVTFYFILIGIFAWLGFMESWRSQSCFSRILAIALVMSIAVQTLINIAVVANIIPTTGIPLPFISSGGSSLLMTLVSAGLIVNVSKQNYINGVNAGDNGVHYDG